MDNLVLLLIVLVPGAMVKNIINERIPGPRRVKSQIEEIVEYLEYGVIVLLLSLAVCYIDEAHFSTLSQFLTYLGSTDFLLKYLVLTWVITVLVGNFLSMKSVTTARLRLANWIRKQEGRCGISEYNTVYDEIFFNREWKIDHQVVEIKKGRDTVTRGVIISYPQPESGVKEIALGSINEIENIFLLDQEKSDPNEKIFGSILHTYYDVDSDVLYVFFDSAKYKAKKVEEYNMAVANPTVS